ncbi:MAG TPA: AAA family ATPase [Terriglobales bacterium]|nr:AAA family ATPase [Terriglobales bacterium]
MYKKFFGLTKNPFEISPDPYFFYGSAQHNEALANIFYGIRAHKGFVVVTGEVGTGKTLLVRCLLDSLDRNQVAFSYVFNTRLNEEEFIRYIMQDLNLNPPASKGSMLLQLNEYLIGRYRKGLTTVLIVDEAQNLSWEVLEEIRLLTNLESTKDKLLQIVLIGQPELDEKLESYNVRQLKQRIALRCRLNPLSELETRDYIVRRLQRAGAKSNAWVIFPDPVIKKIHQYSTGIPRLINTLCENSLIVAFAKQSASATPEMVDEVARDLRLNQPVRPPIASHATREEQDNKLLKRLVNLLHALEKADESPAGVEQPAPAEQTKV